MLQTIRTFLLNEPKTILALAIAFCIASSFNDVIGSLVSNIFQPLIVKLLALLRINYFVDIKSIVKNNTLNISKFISTFITFICIIIIVYYLQTLSST